VVGIEQFLWEEKQKWACARCGGVISIHDRVCSTCGREIDDVV
jgi:DNA-directed RNA polymerase subunit RPC12/RpoP